MEDRSSIAYFAREVQEVKIKDKKDTTEHQTRALEPRRLVEHLGVSSDETKLCVISLVDE